MMIYFKRDKSGEFFFAFGETDLAKPTRLLAKSNSVYQAPMKTSPRIQSGPAGGGISIPAKPEMQTV